MNRRAFLRFLGLAPVAAQIASLDAALVQAAAPLIEVKATTLPFVTSANAARRMARLVQISNELLEDISFEFPTPAADAQRRSARTAIVDQPISAGVCAVRGEADQGRAL